jgi:hypothetical protein
VHLNSQLLHQLHQVQTMFDVLNELVIPLAGLITATVLFFSPLKEMLRISKSRVIGTLNIFPLAMIVPNCLAWMVSKAVPSCVGQQMSLHTAYARC